MKTMVLYHQGNYLDSLNYCVLHVQMPRFNTLSLMNSKQIHFNPKAVIIRVTTINILNKSNKKSYDRFTGKCRQNYTSCKDMYCGKEHSDDPCLLVLRDPDEYGGMCYRITDEGHITNYDVILENMLVLIREFYPVVTKTSCRRCPITFEVE